MSSTKADIISQLQRDILPLQGYKPVGEPNAIDFGLGPVREAFPGRRFPLGAIHELVTSNVEDEAPTCGFLAGMIAGLMRNGGVSVWISASRTLFPPALVSFGIEPDKVLFIHPEKERDALWVMEEALKCGGLAAVVGEIRDLDFTASRRLQLVVEQSRVTGFVFRRNPRKLNTTACVTRWKISHLPSEREEGFPGIGFPKWRVELLKVRNGKPGHWEIVWEDGKFRHAPAVSPSTFQQTSKTGTYG